LILEGELNVKLKAIISDIISWIFLKLPSNNPAYILDVQAIFIYVILF